GSALGMNDSLRFIEVPREVYLADGSAVWLRLLPTTDPLRTWSAMELRSCGANSVFLLSTLLPSYQDLGFVRADDGFGVYAAMRGEPTPAVTYAFEKGEVWSIDTYLIPALRERVGPTGKFGLPWLDLERDLKHAIDRLQRFLSK